MELSLSLSLCKLCALSLQSIIGAHFRPGVLEFDIVTEYSNAHQASVLSLQTD